MGNVKIKMSLATLVRYAYVKLKIETYRAEEILMKAKNHSLFKCYFATTGC